MFRHRNITEDTQAIPAAHPLQGLLENASRLRRRQQRRTPITTEGEEVQIVGFLVSLESLRHRTNLQPGRGSRCDGS